MRRPTPLGAGRLLDLAERCEHVRAHMPEKRGIDICVRAVPKYVRVIGGVGRFGLPGPCARGELRGRNFAGGICHEYCASEGWKAERAGAGA